MCLEEDCSQSPTRKIKLIFIWQKKLTIIWLSLLPHPLDAFCCNQCSGSMILNCRRLCRPAQEYLAIDGDIVDCHSERVVKDATVTSIW